jgi:hypothetical protein
LFGPVDVAAEFLTFGSRLNDRSAVRNEVMKMGFDWYFVEGDGLFKKLRNVGRCSPLHSMS